MIIDTEGDGKEESMKYANSCLLVDFHIDGNIHSFIQYFHKKTSSKVGIKGPHLFTSFHIYVVVALTSYFWYIIEEIFCFFNVLFSV